MVRASEASRELILARRILFELAPFQIQDLERGLSRTILAINLVTL